MQQATEIKREMCRIKSIITVILHGRKVELAGFDSFFGVKNVDAKSFLGFSSVGGSSCCRPSLSRKLTGSFASGRSRSRLQRASLQLSKSYSAEAHFALHASRVVSDVPAAAMDADAPRFQAEKKQDRYSIASRARDGVTSRILTHPRVPRGLEYHTLKNVAARLSVVCGPEIHSYGTAVSQ